MTSDQIIENLVGRENIYALGHRASGRKSVKPGDWLCFYSSGKGVIAHARVKSPLKAEQIPHIAHLKNYPWVFHVDGVKLYPNDPVAIDVDTRSRLDAFQSKEQGTQWAWFVRNSLKLTKHDFEVLTRQRSEDRVTKSKKLSI